MMKGFTYYHYLSCFDEAVAQMKAWIASGQLKYFEQQENGLENFAGAFNKLFTGGNRGKLIVNP